MSSMIILLVGGFTFAAVTAYGFTWLARLVAPQLGFVDRPDGGRKQHAGATPLLGGVAIFAAFLLTLAIFLAWDPHGWLANHSQRLVAMLASGAGFCLLGLWDDRYPLRARDKLLLQILAALPFAYWGHQVEIINVAGLRLELGLWSMIFAVFWLVSCANVVNLIDGLDGLASSIGLIAISALAAMAWTGSVPWSAFVSLAFAGGVAGFLVHNWPPARIFLGDAGSLTIGFMIGAVAIESSTKTTAGFVLAFPLVLLGVPIFDTAMAILRRKLTGRGIGEADRGHIHHRLQERGLTKLQTLLAIVAICTVMAVTCLMTVAAGQDVIALALGVAVISLVVAGRVFGFHEMMLVFRHLELLQVTVATALRELTGRNRTVHLGRAEVVSVEPDWNTMASRLQDGGGLAWEMAGTAGNGQHGAFEKIRAGNTSIQKHQETWQFYSTFVRDDGLRTSFVVVGYQDPQAETNNVDQITSVLEACHHRLPPAGTLHVTDSDDSSLSPPVAGRIGARKPPVNAPRRAA